MEADGGRERGRIGGGRGTGGGRRKGGKRDFQSDENREKWRKIAQYRVTFYNRNRTERREPQWKGAESGSERYARRKFQTPLSSPTMIKRFSGSLSDRFVQPGAEHDGIFTQETKYDKPESIRIF